MSVILVLRRLRQEDCELEGSMGYRVESLAQKTNPKPTPQLNNKNEKPIDPLINQVKRPNNKQKSKATQAFMVSFWGCPPLPQFSLCWRKEVLLRDSTPFPCTGSYTV